MLSPVKQKSISPPSSKSPGGSPASSKSASSPSIAPPTADVTPVITGDGRIYHPCHGHSFRAVSIFDLFPGIVRYQSKRFTERDRVDFLLAHSERSFLDNVDEAAMWLTALKYLLNDAVLRPFDRLSPEVHFVLRSYMSNHRKRTSLLTSIRTHGLLCVLGSLQQKVPASPSRDDIRRKMRTAERRRLKREVARREIAAREEARRVYEHQMQMAAAANYHSMFGYNAGNVGNVGANSYNVNVAPFGHGLGGHAVAYDQEQQQGMATIDADVWEMVQQIKVEQKDVAEAELEMQIQSDAFRAVLQSEFENAQELDYGQIGDAPWIDYAQ